MKIKMNKLICIIHLILFSCTMAFGFAKQDTLFNEVATWNDALLKAKAEHKYIFVDCYTTWCKPCREMDREVYSDSQVVRNLQDGFVPVKLQMDSTNHDNNDVKKWYQDGQRVKNRYAVLAYPTYLFFDGDGNIIHKGLGFKDKNDFLKLLREASDTGKQYFNSVRKFERKKLPFSEYPSLINQAKQLQDRSVAMRVARDFIKRFILTNGHLNTSRINSDNLSLIAGYLSINDGELFDLFNRKGAQVDSILNRKGVAQYYTEDAIARDMIRMKILKSEKPFIPAVSKPEWKLMEVTIAKRFGEQIAPKLIIMEKLNWYKNKRDTIEHAKAILAYCSEYLDYENEGLRSGVNNYVWYYIFNPVSDRYILKGALALMDRVLKYEGGNNSYWDTYANVLYKSGDADKAIEIEERIVKAEPAHQSFVDNLNKMKKGEPTWNNVFGIK